MRTILLQEILGFYEEQSYSIYTGGTFGKNLKSRKEMKWMFIKIYTVDRFGQQKRKLEAV